MLEDQNCIDRLKDHLHLSDGELNIEIGAAYNVYGLALRKNGLWYYICSDPDDLYPSAYPAELFSILESKISDHWKLDFTVKEDELPTKEFIVSFAEWSQDSNFYERLVDGDPKAIKIFLKYKNLIDMDSY